MAGFNQDKAWLAALDPKPIGDAPGVVVAIVRWLGVHLGVQSLQLAGMLGGLRAVEQLVRQAGR
jgi:hypothetical protein